MSHTLVIIVVCASVVPCLVILVALSICCTCWKRRRQTYEVDDPERPLLADNPPEGRATPILTHYSSGNKDATNVSDLVDYAGVVDEVQNVPSPAHTPQRSGAFDDELPDKSPVLQCCETSEEPTDEPIIAPLSEATDELHSDSSSDSETNDAAPHLVNLQDESAMSPDAPAVIYTSAGDYKGSPSVSAFVPRVSSPVDSKKEPVDALQSPSAVDDQPSAPPKQTEGLQDSLHWSFELPNVPAIVEACVQHIEASGLTVKGIYRVSGNLKEINRLRSRFQTVGDLPDLSRESIHDVCGCLKDYLLKLNEPLVTYHLRNYFVTAARLEENERSLKIIRQAVRELPQPNRDVLIYLILHLRKVASSTVCEMTVDNLQIVFGPSFIGFSSPDLQSIDVHKETAEQQQTMKKLLSLSSRFWSKLYSSPKCV